MVLIFLPHGNRLDSSWENSSDYGDFNYLTHTLTLTHIVHLIYMCLRISLLYVITFVYYSFIQFIQFCYV